jgi:hypothetical protein
MQSPSERAAMGIMTSSEAQAGVKTIYWHRELPPANAEPMGSHTIEAVSNRVPGTLAHRDELWDQCYRELAERLRERLEQEIARLGGAYAHVLGEHIEPRHDDRTGEAWMYGRFEYELYGRAAAT